MKVFKPAYYDSFRCIASACPDSCCQEWDVQVDEEKAEFYRGLPGALGDRLREVLKTEDGETVMTIVDGRCPMWRRDGLCRIQAELGEQALCQVCRDFPRLRHEYGDFVELGLELSCPEAARILLSAPNLPMMESENGEAGEGDYEAEVMDCLRASRETALALLSNPAYTPAEALALLLIYGYQVQDVVDGGEVQPFREEASLESARELAKPGDPEAFLAFFRELELLTDRWQELLSALHCQHMTEKTRALARYLVQRYWLQAVSDYDLTSRVKFIVISCILVSLLGGNMEETAQLFSKEIENDADNVDAILDGAYTCSAFTDDKLLGMLLLGYGV